MFSECSSLKEINLSNFNLNKVFSMIWMFSGCSSLKEINLSNFNYNADVYKMFSDCPDELKTKIITRFDKIKNEAF